MDVKDAELLNINKVRNKCNRKILVFLKNDTISYEFKINNINIYKNKLQH